ncbi:MAG: response regulator receiver modulated diguanylate cyclase [Frankiales bacterium]|jgi:two-component system cell cycle response regulator|nr:response regulator receiver modulated diguanylate cyclase [Frankiales bacterium]
MTQAAVPAVATVLVADDSATVRALVRFELETAGYAVVEAADGQEALHLASAGGVDVVLLDVEMPVLDGFGAITELKRDPATAELPVVFLTGRSEGGDVVEALRLGAQDYLTKPPQTPELLARVGAAVQVSGLRAELRRRTEELDRVSRTDHLTGLHNRRHLDEQLHGMLSSSRRHGVPLTVLIIDVDHFKRVNDTAGHPAGDAVLQEVASRLVTSVRDEDVIGRWGGEEFLVLAPHTDLLGGQALAERLRLGVAACPVVVGETALDITVSVGGATVGERGDANTGGGVLQLADANLYAAKEGGRNRSDVTQLGPASADGRVSGSSAPCDRPDPG